MYFDGLAGGTRGKYHSLIGVNAGIQLPRDDDNIFWLVGMQTRRQRQIPLRVKVASRINLIECFA